MSISSIQSLIQKYGANFGFSAQPAPGTGEGAQSSQSASDSASGSTPGSASGSGQGASVQGTADAASKPVMKTSATLPNGDTVSLSPQAMDYLAAHTGPLGKFELPNMMDYFFGAGDAADTEGSSMAGDPFSSLSAFL
jgi:hypothetical protein